MFRRRERGEEVVSLKTCDVTWRVENICERDSHNIQRRPLRWKGREYFYQYALLLHLTLYCFRPIIRKQHCYAWKGEKRCHGISPLLFNQHCLLRRQKHFCWVLLWTTAFEQPNCGFVLQHHHHHHHQQQQQQEKNVETIWLAFGKKFHSELQNQKLQKGCKKFFTFVWKWKTRLHSTIAEIEQGISEWQSTDNKWSLSATREPTILSQVSPATITRNNGVVWVELCDGK